MQEKETSTTMPLSKWDNGDIIVLMFLGYSLGQEPYYFSSGVELISYTKGNAEGAGWYAVGYIFRVTDNTKSISLYYTPGTSMAMKIE